MSKKKSKKEFFITLGSILTLISVCSSFIAPLFTRKFEETEISNKTVNEMPVGDPPIDEDIGLLPGMFIHPPQNPIPTIDPYNQDGYNYIANGTSYTYYMKAHSNWGDGFKFASGGYNIINQPQDYSYRNQLGSQDYLSSISDKTAVIDNINHTATYAEVFPSVTLQYEMQPDMVKEYFIINILPRAPAGWLGTNVTLDFGGYIKYGTAHLYVDGVEQTNKNFITAHQIDFRDDNDNTIYFLPKPYAVDSKGNTTSCYYEVQKKGNQIWFYVRTPYYSFLKNATFPVKVDPTYGLIGDAVTNSWEYDTEEGRYPDMIRLGTSEYYAIVSTGDTGTELDGYIRTIRVWNNNGTIQTSLVDSLEYDTSDGYHPNIINVGTNMYAIEYYDAGSLKETVVTVGIDTSGNIDAAVTDTLQLTNDGKSSYHSQIIHITSNVYCAAYTDAAVTTDLWLETFNITSAGLIDATSADKVEIDTTDGRDADIILVDSDTVAVVYQDVVSFDGYMSTWNISATGDITNTYADFWEFDTSRADTPTIAKVTGNIFMEAHKDTNLDLYVKTFQINDTGSIWKVWIDTQVFETSISNYPTFFNVSVNAVANKWIKGISFMGESSDGYVSTFDVDSTGAIGSEIDTLETYPADTMNWYQPVCFVSGFYFVMATEDGSNDGWLKTFQIYANNPPTISNPSPADGATGVSATPQLSVDVGDIGDILNVNWSSNSSGSLKGFGTNQSIYSYGAISDSVVNSYEYNKQNGQQPDVIKLGSDATFSYYAIVNNGISNDGFINTTKVWNNNGTIYPGNVDSYEYDTSDGDSPSIVHVSGDVYAILYNDFVSGSGSTKVITVSISSLGDITNSIIDTLILTYLSYTTATTRQIINVNSNIYAVVYQNKTCYGILETIWINNSGTINNTVLDTQTVWIADSLSAGFFPRMIMIDSDTIAITFIRNANRAPYLYTYNISSSGVITNTPADTWNYLATIWTGQRPTIIKISGNIFALAYASSATTGAVSTCTIADTGMITKSWISTTTLSPNAEYFNFINSIGNNLYVVTYQDSSGDGQLKTVKITDAGIISCFEYDTLEFDTADSIWYAPILPVANDYYLIVYEGTGNDGWSCTVKIGNDTTTTLKWTNANFSAAGTKYYWRVNVSDGVNQNYSIYSFTTAGGGGNTAPIFSDQNPINNSIDIAVDIGTLTLTIEDLEDDTFDYSWACSDGSSNSAAGNTNGSKILMLNMGDLDYSTIYTWWVNATDEHGLWINETYYFTTESAITKSWQDVSTGWISGGNISGWETINLGWISGGNGTQTWVDIASGWISGGNISIFKTIVTGWISGGNVSTHDIIASGWISGGNNSASLQWSTISSGWISGGNNSASLNWSTIVSGWISGGNGTLIWTGIASGWISGGNGTQAWDNIASGWISGGNGTQAWTGIVSGWISGGNISAYETIASGWISGGNGTQAWTNIASGWISGGNNSASLSWSTIVSGWISGGNIPGWDAISLGWINGGNISAYETIASGWISGGNTTTIIHVDFVYIVEGANIICTSTSSGSPTSYLWEVSDDGVIFGSTDWINDSSGINQIFTYPDGGNICIRLSVKKGSSIDSIMKCIGSMPGNNKDKYPPEYYHNCKACEDVDYYWYNDSCHDTPKPLPWNEKKPLPEAEKPKDIYGINLGGWKIDLRILVVVLIVIGLLYVVFGKKKKKKKGDDSG